MEVQIFQDKKGTGLFEAVGESLCFLMADEGPNKVTPSVEINTNGPFWT